MFVLDGPADPTFRRRLLWAGFLAGLLPFGWLAFQHGGVWPFGPHDNS